MLKTRPPDSDFGRLPGWEPKQVRLFSRRPRRQVRLFMFNRQPRRQVMLFDRLPRRQVRFLSRQPRRRPAAVTARPSSDRRDGLRWSTVARLVSTTSSARDAVLVNNTPFSHLLAGTAPKGSQPCLTRWPLGSMSLHFTRAERSTYTRTHSLAAACPCRISRCVGIHLS